MRFMSTMRYKLDHERHRPAQTMRAPRAGDSIGNALSAAYDVEDALPGDLAALLQRLEEAAGSNDNGAGGRA